MSRVNISGQSTGPVTNSKSPSHETKIVDIGEDDEQVQSEIFSTYSCGSLKFGKEHPGDIAEPSGLALIPLPDPSYPIQQSIPEEIIDTAKLSKLQLEGVLYACQRHLCFLPNGDRCGFFIGDGAGVGKGRQIAGIILDNWARGRFQHVWFSVSRDLREDARRDLGDLGLHIKIVDGCQELDAESKAFGLSSEFKEGVLFTTYSTLIGGARNGKISRLDQIVAWCGGKDAEWRKILSTDQNGRKVEKDALFAPNFSGVIVFDECHKAKNFSVTKEGEDKASDKGSQTARCVIEIQHRLPKARVVYCSATGVTELSNLAYCERLGLWGKGLPFSSFDLFHRNASKRGVFFLEMLAMELKRSGAYVSRGLSFKQTEFETLHCPLTPSMIREYNTAAEFWVKVRRDLQQAIALSGAPNRLLSTYWGAHQRFFRQLILAYKVDFIVERARHCLENGLAVVIGLQTTGEAAQSRGIERRKGCASTFISACRETIISFLELNWPIKVVNDTKDESELDRTSAPDAKIEAILNCGSGTSESLPLQKSSAPAGSVIAECEQLRNRLLEEADSLNLPFSALDDLIDKLGGNANVAEMTGRKGRLVRSPTGAVTFQLRGAQDDDVDQVNIIECNRFMKGTKQVAIISDAASTGISLHASNECPNSRRRMHFTMELPWSADKAVQQLGRTHRSNQASGPIYSLVVTDLGGERRFAAAVAKRLQSLGALTKGDRRAAAGQNLHEFDLDNQYGRDSVRKILEAIDGGTSIAVGASPQELKRICGNICLRDGHDVRTWDGMGDTSSEKSRWILAINGHFQKALDTIGFGQHRKESDSNNVTKFLGRLLGLSVPTQNALFHYFFSVLEYGISSAIKEGRYTDSITDLFGAECVVERIKVEDIYKDHISGATSVVHTLRVDRGLSWESALAKLQSYMGRLEVAADISESNTGFEMETQLDRFESCDAKASSMSSSSEIGKVMGSELFQGVVATEIAKEVSSSVDDQTKESDSADGTAAGQNPTSGFYETKYAVPGRGSNGWILALQRIDRPNSYIVCRPNTGSMRVEMDVDELRSKYVARDQEHAESGWRRLYEASVSFEIGRRVLTVHLLTGTLVPLWEQIEHVVNSCANSSDSTLSKRDLDMKVVRVKVDGQYSVGLKFPSQVIKSLRKRFQLYSLLQQGRALQISPPQFNPATVAQLSSGQGLVVTVKVFDREAHQQKGVVTPSSTDSSSYILRFPWSAGKHKQAVEATFKFGSSMIQTVLIDPALNSSDRPNMAQCQSNSEGIPEAANFSMQVEGVDPVLAKALSKALTAPHTIRKFFAALPKAEQGSPSSEQSSIPKVGSFKGTSKADVQVQVHCGGGIKRKVDDGNLTSKNEEVNSDLQLISIESRDMEAIQRHTGLSSSRSLDKAGHPQRLEGGANLKQKAAFPKVKGSGTKPPDIFEVAKRAAGASNCRAVQRPGAGVDMGNTEVMDLTCDD